MTQVFQSGYKNFRKIFFVPHYGMLTSRHAELVSASQYKKILKQVKGDILEVHLVE